MGLRDLRERNGLTLQQLDSLTGVDFTRLWVYENHADEARNMYLGTAAKLAQALHCNVLDLYPDEHVWRGGVSAGVVGLKNIRKARRLTQVELAGLSGIARPAISRFETNGRPVSQMYLRTALRLSEALQCDPVDFLTEGYLNGHEGTQTETRHDATPARRQSRVEPSACSGIRDWRT